MIDTGVRECFFQARLDFVRKGLVLNGGPDIDPRLYLRREPVRTVRIIIGEPAATEGGGREDVLRVLLGRNERKPAAHAVARRTDAARPHVALRCKEIEKRGHIRHDVGRRRSRGNFPTDLAFLGIGEDRLRAPWARTDRHR